MKISLQTTSRRWLAGFLVAVFACAYLGFAAMQLAASWFGGRADLTSLRRAAWLDSRNADYRYALGRYYDLVVRDPVAAVEQYKTATHLNPHSARYWFDLASAYQVLGKTTDQTDALDRAIEADATTPDVAWEAGNFFLVQGDNEKALRELRVVIANDPTNANAALQLCWHIQPDVDTMLRTVVPARGDTYIDFLGLLENRQETAGAAKVWNALVESRQPFQLRDAYDYIHYAIQHKDVDQAASAWQQVTSRFGLSSYLQSPTNLVINGNFDLNLLNAGFDWQYQKQSGVQLTLDPSDHHAGRRSLMIRFDGPGIGDAGIFELVVVKPNTTYQFSAFYKNGEMEGAGGPHFTVQDTYTQAVYYESDELKDAGFWKSVDGEFTTGPDCKLVVLHIRRLPEGSPIRGRLWVGDFQITQKSSEATPSSKAATS